MKVESYVVKQLEAICRKHPVRRKILLAPSRQAGYNLTNWLAREGSAWTNLNVESPISLAERLALPTLRARGLEPLSPDEGLFAVHEAVASALRALPQDGSTPLASGPGLTRSVQATLESLRLAHVGPEALAQRLGEDARSRFLLQAYTAYMRRVEARRSFDAASVYEAASVLATSSPFLQQSVLVLLDEVRLSAAETRFVRACAEASSELLRVGRPDFNVDPPPDAVARRFAAVPFVEPTRDNVHPAGQVRATHLQASHRELVRVRDAVGADAEVRGVFREIVASRIPLDDVEIAYTTPEPYVPLISSLADVLELPAAFGEGIPAALSRPGQAISGFFRWIAGGFDAEVLVHLLRSRLISFPDSAVSASGLAEILEVRRARSGKPEHLAAIDRERIALGERVSADEAKTRERESRISAYERALQSIVDLVGEGESTVSAVADAGLSFLGRFFKAGSEADARSLESIADRLAGLRAVDSSADVSGLAEMLADLMRRHRVGISAAREGHLYVVPVSRAGCSGRSNTFVIGLDESSFPGGAVEDPLLPDFERRRISPELGERLGRPGERVWQLLRFLGAVPGQVTLVANRFDLIDGRERYASSVFAQVREDLAVKHPPKYAPSFAPEDAMTEAEAWITQREAPDYRTAADDRYPWLASGAFAEAERSSPRITRYDGYLGAETPELSLRQGEVLSASRLERLVSCPYRYFLQDVLKIRALDESDPDDHRWLNPREFGSVVHELLCDFMTGLAEVNVRPDWNRHRAELHALVEKKSQETRKKIPPETELAFRADVRRLKRTMDVFLAADSKRDYGKALEFELRFGYGEDSPRYASPVQLDLSDDVRLALRGSIDRIDVGREGFMVWDYKTGSAAPFYRSDLFEGEKLQWALYALAYRRLVEGLPTDLDVARSGYFFVSERESGRLISSRIPAPEEVARRLRPPLVMAELGAFLHFQRLKKSDSPCRFCDFRQVCEKERRDADSLDEADPSPIPDTVMNQLTEWMTL